MIEVWQREHIALLQKTRILDLCEATDVSPYTGKAHHFISIDCAAWVNMVPITEENEVVMIRQYRHGSQDVTLEIPGGMVDAGEEPAQAAMRECKEETGYVANAVNCLGVLNPNPAIFNNYLHTYLATGVTQVGSIQNTATEETVVELIPVSDLQELLVSGAIDHALVAATLWRYLYFRQG